MTSTEKPKAFDGIGIEEQLGAKIDLTMPVKDEAGNIVPLSTYFTKEKPVILSLVYFDCPGLCNYHLNGLSDGMKQMTWKVGENFQVVSLSIDPRENSEMATRKKDNYLKALGQPQAASGWHFLTADQAVITQLAKTVGFKYRWDEKNKDWAHASAAILVTPEGKVSRYLHGVYFEPKDLKLGLIEASNEKIGTLTDRLIYFCYHYDASKSQYSIMAVRLMQIGAVLIMLLLAALIVPAWLRSRRQESKA